MGLFGKLKGLFREKDKVINATCEVISDLELVVQVLPDGRPKEKLDKNVLKLKGVCEILKLLP